MIKLSKKGTLMPKFVKIDGFWWEYDPRTPKESATLYSIISFARSSYNNLTGLEIVDCDEKDLNWENTVVYDGSYLTGWLSPEGAFYGCDFNRHKEQAHLVHKCSERDMEDRGFVKITKCERKLVALLPIRKDHRALTASQYNFLKKLPINNFDEIEFFYRIKMKEQSKNDFEM